MWCWYLSDKKLFKDYNINIYGCIELNHLYPKCNDNPLFMSLKKLSKTVLDIDMKYKFEDKSITCSDWQTMMI